MEAAEAEMVVTHSEYLSVRIRHIDESIFNKTQAQQVLLNSGHHDGKVRKKVFDLIGRFYFT